MEVIPAGASYNPTFEDHQVGVQWVLDLTWCRFHGLESLSPFALPHSPFFPNLSPHLFPSLEVVCSGTRPSNENLAWYEGENGSAISTGL